MRPDFSLKKQPLQFTVVHELILAKRRRRERGRDGNVLGDHRRDVKLL